MDNPSIDEMFQNEDIKKTRVELNKNTIRAEYEEELLDRMENNDDDFGL